jgi:hypothetical protein
MTSWHIPSDVLSRYATDPVAVDDVTASSVELHLVECTECRASLSAGTDVSWLGASWDAVADCIDVVPVTPVERVLRSLGLNDSYARLVAATRALQLSWLAAMVAVVLASIALAHRVDAAGPFLVVAPVIPLAAVAVAFLPGGDPAGEAAAAAPMTTTGLALRRAVAVLTVSLVVVALGSMAVPGVSLSATLWILPALGLSLAALALATWIRVEIAAAILAGAWFAALWVAAAFEAHPIVVTDLLPLSSVGQVVCAGLAIGGGVVVVVRGDALGTIGRSAPS